MANLAATAGSNRWVPRIGFDTSQQSHLDIVAELHQRRGVSVEDMAVLNEPITMDEVVEILQSLPSVKLQMHRA